MIFMLSSVQVDQIGTDEKRWINTASDKTVLDLPSEVKTGTYTPTAPLGPDQMAVYVDQIIAMVDSWEKNHPKVPVFKLDLSKAIKRHSMAFKLNLPKFTVFSWSPQYGWDAGQRVIGPLVPKAIANSLGTYLAIYDSTSRLLQYNSKSALKGWKP
jgi:hypothetical protein